MKAIITFFVIQLFATPLIAADADLVKRIQVVNAKKVINEWKSSSTKIDLSGANLSYADLSGADFRLADLSGADLRGANLTGADLRGAYLRGANLAETNPSMANLHEAKGLSTEMQEKIIQLLRESWE